MPAWAQIAIGVAAVLTALGVIWQKFVKPGSRLISTSERVVPVMIKFTDTFEGEDGAFEVLRAIQSEFRNNGGSTLRDTIDEIAAAAIKAQVAASAQGKQVDELARQIKDLRIIVATQKEIADQDRVNLQSAIVTLGVLTAKVNEGLQQNKEMAEANAEVAKNLEASVQRADAVVGDSGASADAAVRSAPAPDENVRPLTPRKK